MAPDIFDTENGIMNSMKLSIVLSVQPASFSALAYEGKLEENIFKIKSFGYDGIELAIRDPGKIDLRFLNSILAKVELPVAAIGTGQAFGEEGISFTHPSKELREKAVERIKLQMKLAETLGTKVIIGLIRGRKESDLNDDQINDWLIEALKNCASSNRNVKIAIEPINRYETNIINSVESGIEILKEVNMSNVGLLLDTFHMNIEEPSIIESIKLARNRLFHFHIADSNRWYPGAGHIDFGKILETLDEIGYSDFISAEILPLPDPDTAAERTINYMREL